LGGRAVWITGKSGTGKTTLAKLLAAEIADPLCVDEMTGRSLTGPTVRTMAAQSRYMGLGIKTGRVFIVNESQGLKREAIEELLDILEAIPDHVAWIFTTTTEGQERLFDESIDAHPLLSRCTVVPLTSQGLSKPFAAYLESVDPLGPRPAKFYSKLIEDCRNNLREALSWLESDALANAIAEPMYPEVNKAQVHTVAES
jgi:replication-associated recombination protein RarA